MFERGRAVVPKVGCTASWGALEVGSSKHVVRLFMTEVALDQIP